MLYIRPDNKVKLDSVMAFWIENIIFPSFMTIRLLPIDPLSVSGLPSFERPPPLAPALCNHFGGAVFSDSSSSASNLLWGVCSDSGSWQASRSSTSEGDVVVEETDAVGVFGQQVELP